MRLVLAAAAAALLLASPAAAASIPDGGVTAAEVAEVLKERGYRAEIGKDGHGDPQITSAAEGKTFLVVFFSCRDARCAAYQFSAGFDVDASPGLVKANEWNRKFRFGRLFLDEEDDPILQMDVDAERGHTTEAIDNNLDTWVSILARFKREFDL